MLIAIESSSPITGKLRSAGPCRVLRHTFYYLTWKSNIEPHILGFQELGLD